ncbi:hypothetical protein ES703_60537 [subsurface metagenome]
MPERKIIGVSFARLGTTGFTDETDEAFKNLTTAIQEGWRLDPTFYQTAGRPQPMRLENAVIYHLIKYSAEELASMAKEKDLEPQIIDVKKVPHDEVKDLVKQGYRVKEIYAKDVVLVKTGVPERDE